MSDDASIHVPVMLAQIVQWLEPSAGGLVVDGTLGGGGHSRALAELVGPDGRVIALDCDPKAVQRARIGLTGLPVEPIHANFRDLPEVLAELDLDSVDAVVLDLGLSSDQLADRERGFSFASEGPLDLRFDSTRGEPASRLVNRLSAKHLADLIFAYGEERFSRRIAQAIVQRKQQPIHTAVDLADVVRRAVGRGRQPTRIDPATRTFQALRIAVNEELKSLEIALRRVPDCLVSGGRFGVITFHSLEDRRVKTAFRDDPHLKVLTRRPLRPSEEETEKNPRARSAKLALLNASKMLVCEG